ncbi:hypothetical protein [Flavobacterium adhaerens]|uniref:hypothetical protein n=1 Tax=Flavobacterium adhaerens TaxID=3149043 RepID=UPI0032B31C8D
MKPQTIKTTLFTDLINHTSVQTKNALFEITIDDEVTLQKYCEAVIAKIFELTRCQLFDFVTYQTNHAKDPGQWLCSFENLIENNEELFTSKKGLIRFTKIFTVIDEKRVELRCSSVKDTKSKIPKKLINAESRERYFSFDEIRKEVDTLVCNAEKIMLLTKEKFEYQNANIEFINQKLPLYDQQCMNQIEQINALQKLKSKLVRNKIEEESPPFPFKKLRFNGNINQLVDVFYQLNRELYVNGKSYIDANTNDLIDFIVNSFLDKDGNEISPLTVKTILKPSREDKRPNTHKRIDLDKML